LLLGLGIGIFFGVAPGINGAGAAALFLPFTFHLDAIAALLALVGIYVGSIFSGSITAITLNIPGDPCSVATTFDGYPLFKKGMGGKALGTAIFASAVGGLFSSFVLATSAPQLAKIALELASPEFFAFAFLGLMTVIGLDESSMIKSTIAVLIGIILSMVGLNEVWGIEIFTGGTRFLANGFSMIPVLMGLFAISEVLTRIMGDDEDAYKTATKTSYDLKIATQLPSFSDLYAMKGVILISCFIGLFVGFLPGAGATIAALLAYSIIKRVSKQGKLFGTGVLAGVAAPETANNASTGGALIPLLALGIPGSMIAAVMIGAFMIHGLQPGPMLFQQTPLLAYSIFAGMILANALIIVTGMLAAKGFSYFIKMPLSIMDPIIILLCVVGVYGDRNNLGDVWVMFLFGVLGYFLRRSGYSLAGLILGFILGPIIENSFTVSMISSRGNFWVFFTRPISLFVIITGILFLVAPIVAKRLIIMKRSFGWPT